ncbi:MAG TPA: RagB/SusD family nutrient uptake outer membrane protein [Lutibacter sp.]|nr:RagB/SusD family nutrient uptake outer membrane protein [Lutibacter sp.]
MKLLKYNLILVIAIASLFVGCEKDFNNVNKPAENQVFSTREGIIGASVGMTQDFTNSTMSPIVEVSALSTRELGNLSTYLTPEQLVAGGLSLPDDNAGIVRLWSRLLRDKGVAESIIASVDAIELQAGTKSGLKAYAKFFKAMTLGYLIQNFEKAPINNEVDATFSDRATVLAECISLLESAKSDISATPVSDEFTGIFPDIDLLNMINAYAARYNLFAGNYTAAIAAADAVDLTSKSVWIYDGSNENPVWKFAVYNEPDTKPQDNFGLLGDYIPEAGDGRIAFYLDPSDEVEVDFGYHSVENALGFFTSASASIPVYLPSEMLLIKAEAYAQTDLPSAIAPLNAVRTKTDDIFGVNAGLLDWTGDVTDKTAVLNEIYKNRCIELFLTGMRLEDSRRMHGSFTPSDDIDYINERNRNYYPYPFAEKENNVNCPSDPSI